MSTMNIKPHTLGAVAMGVVYGLILRLGFGQHLTDQFLQIISTTFLMVAPFCVGAVTVLGAAQDGEPLTKRRQAGVASVAMLLFLFAMFAFFVEGLICIVLVLPVFIIAAILGGLLAGFIHNHVRLPRSTLPAFALLPFHSLLKSSCTNVASDPMHWLFFPANLAGKVACSPLKLLKVHSSTSPFSPR